MKSIKIYAFGITGLLLAGMGLVSCTKSFDSRLTAQYGNEKNSNVQLYIAAVGASRNYLYVDSKPVNGASLTSGSLFPSAANGFSVPTGLRNFLLKDTLTAATQAQLSFAENMEIGKNYTVFAYDTSTAIKQKTVENNIVIPADTTARLRFANFVYNPLPIEAFDIFSKNKQQTIFTNVQVTDVTAFIPYESNRADTFFLRQTGTGTNLQIFVPSTTAPPGVWADIALILTPTPKRSYTLVFRGGYRAVTSTNATARTLSAFANY